MSSHVVLEVPEGALEVEGVLEEQGLLVFLAEGDQVVIRSMWVISP